MQNNEDENKITVKSTFIIFAIFVIIREFTFTRAFGYPFFKML
jgi:hypothetical protein